MSQSLDSCFSVLLAVMVKDCIYYLALECLLASECVKHINKIKDVASSEILAKMIARSLTSSWSFSSLPLPRSNSRALSWSAMAHKVVFWFCLHGQRRAERGRERGEFAGERGNFLQTDADQQTACA